MQPIDGANLYAKIVNAWCLRIRGRAPAAHRNRIDMLVAHLIEEARRTKAAGKRLRVMNIGCGPAVEIQRFIRESELVENCDFHLMDFNDETIAYADSKIKGALRESGRHANVIFEHKSVDELLKEVAGLRGEQNREIYDFVYCATGVVRPIFRTAPASALLQHFVNWTVPGGLVVATNVHSSQSGALFHGTRHGMASHLSRRSAHESAG